MTYVTKESYESQKERLEGNIRYEKLQALREKLQQEQVKLSAAKIDTAATQELPKQAQHRLDAAKLRTAIEGYKRDIVAIDNDTHRAEVGLRTQLGEVYLTGLQVQLSQAKAAVDAAKDALLNAGSRKDG